MSFTTACTGTSSYLICDILFPVQQQLTNMKNESDLKSQQNEVCNRDFNEMIRALSSSLQEKEATAAQLQNELQKAHVASTPEQLLRFIKLTIEITEVECKLQEAEYQKQQADLVRKVQVQEMENRQSFKAELHSQLGELSCHKYFITSLQYCNNLLIAIK